MSTTFAAVEATTVRPTGRRPPDHRIRLRSLMRGPAWPITYLIVGYPLWWALGIADFMWIILAVPMVARMAAWRARRARYEA